VTFIAVLRIRDPVGFYDPWEPDPESGKGKIQMQDPVSGMNIPDLNFENLISVFWVKTT
jgi:hypothetical protein